MARIYGKTGQTEEAVRCYTLNNAFAEFREHEKGSIEKGKLADLVVLGGDPWTVPPEEIGGLEILRTVVGGADVWRT
jgi:predicted amidohydrolase YtcJ